MKSLIYILLLLFPAVSKSQIITTISGNGQNLSTGDGGPAVSATLAAPVLGICDKAGNYYFTELYTHSIRKISENGIITTIVGTGSSGYNGDNIPAINAALSSPQQIAIDKQGNIYIADAANQRVRKVDPVTGIITTFAGNGSSGYSGDGGPAVNASLQSPYGVCVDSIGNVFIGDHTNLIVRKVDTFGVITTYAGIPGVWGTSGDGGPAPLAKFFNLKFLCADSKNNIYVIDNERIRKIDAVTNAITTVAGDDSTGGYNGDNIPATAALLNVPTAIGIDINDNLFIADRSNNRIRKVDTFGIITTVVGNGSQGFSGDGGLATNAELNWPQGISVDTCNNLYLTTVTDNRIRKVTYDTCDVTSTKIINKQTPSIHIFPNPAYSQITITANSKLKEAIIRNAIGQVAIQQNINKEKAEINISHLQPGIYFVTVINVSGGKVVKKIVKE